MPDFRCNVCGEMSVEPGLPVDREQPSCGNCGSTIRTRSLIRALVLELFGTETGLPDLPRVKSLRGLGTSDSVHYADRLAIGMDYRNTYFDREPRLDLGNVPEDEFGKYDFVISSEVLEHVMPPASTAFENVFRMLKPGGVFLLTVPYSLDEGVEHYPDLYQFGLAEIDGQTVVVNRRRDGRFEVHENPEFHRSDEGRALEMRVYSESLLRRMLADAGFRQIKIYGENCRQFGIIQNLQYSLPIAARKGTFAFSQEAVRDVLEQWLALRGAFKALQGKKWYEVGPFAAKASMRVAEKTDVEWGTAMVYGDPAAVHYLEGFHATEPGGWRWTARRFSVGLRPPPAALEHGGRVLFSFNIPEEVQKALGGLTLTAFVQGKKLKSVSYESAGAHMFRADVAAELLLPENVTVRFELDKSLPPSEKEGRELGVVAVAVGIQSL